MSSAITPTIQMTPLPAGVVLPYAGSSSPTGYVFCDGSELDKDTYPLLYAAIGDIYATQINPTTGAAWASPSSGKFRVPDYRGTFLRGAGTPYQGDAVSVGGWQTGKTKTNPTGSGGITISAGAASGTFSSSSHTHTEGTMAAQFYGTGGNSIAWNRVAKTFSGSVNGSASLTYGTPGSTSNYGIPVEGATDGPSATASVSYTAQTLGAGDSETRPHNKGVNYIISTGRY